jgi:hypothetical protein
MEIDAAARQDERGVTGCAGVCGGCVLLDHTPATHGPSQARYGSRWAQRYSEQGLAHGRHGELMCTVWLLSILQTVGVFVEEIRASTIDMYTDCMPYERVIPFPYSRTKGTRRTWPKANRRRH